jgi:hypothetical protein
MKKLLAEIGKYLLAVVVVGAVLSFLSLIFSSQALSLIFLMVLVIGAIFLP